MLTHAVYDTLTGEVVKEFPNIAEAFRYNAEVGGSLRGYIVAPIDRPPVKVPVRNPEPAKKPEASDPEGPGLFD